MSQPKPARKNSSFSKSNGAESSLEEAAQKLVEHLSRAKLRVVFAESCTGGRVTAALTEIPGVSQWLCGSAVTYRAATKVAWLDVDPSVIEQHSAESTEVASAMARHVLERTPEATVSGAVSGHLGPDAPAEFDGVVFVAVAFRQGAGVSVDVQLFHLGTMQRGERQREASTLVLGQVTQAIVQRSQD